MDFAPPNLTCFQCGAPVRKTGPDPLPMCDNCRRKEHKATDIRTVQWMIRRGEERVDGPFNRTQMLDLIGIGRIEPVTDVQRVGEEWKPCGDHDDFRGAWIADTLEWRVVQEVSRRRAERERVEAGARRRAVLGKVAKGVAAVSLVAGAVVLLPVSVKDQAAAAYERVRTDGPGALFRTEQAVSIPGDARIAEIQARRPGGARTKGELYAAGAQHLWTGPTAGAKEAVAVLEEAVSLAPRDPVALAALVEAYAWNLRDDASLAGPLSELVERISALEPDGVAAHRALAAAHWSRGRKEAAIAEAELCEQRELTPGSEPGAGFACSFYKASAKGDRGLLEELAEAHPEVRPVRLELAEVLHKLGLDALALQRARVLTREDPGDGEAWTLVALGAAAVGEWDEAVAAAGKVEPQVPHQLDARRVEGDVWLKVRGKPKEARVAYQAVVDSPHFETYLGTEAAWGGLAMAAALLGDAPAATAAADRCLTLHPRAFQCILAQASVAVAAGDKAAVQDAIERVELANEAGRLAAQYLLASARFYDEIDVRDRALQTLQQSRQEDPGWPVSLIEGARIRLAVENVPGAIDDLMNVGLVDYESMRDESPLVGLWLPPKNIRDLREAVSKVVQTDARYSKQQDTILAILDWVSGQSGVRAQLEAVVAVGKGGRTVDQVPLAAQGALLQHLLRAGEWARALELADQVLIREPENTLFHAFRGRALVGLGRTEEARAALERGLATPRPSPRARLWYLDLQLRQGGGEAAMANLERLVKEEPGYLPAQQLLLEQAARKEP